MKWIALFLSAVACSSCSGPYSRSAVAAKEDRPAVVRTARAELQSIPAVVTATGELLAEETATIGVKIPGRVVKLHVDLGSVVTANQVLAELDPTDYQFRLRHAEAVVSQTRAQLGIAEGDSDEVRPDETATVQEAAAVAQEARVVAETSQQLQKQGVLSRLEFEKAQARRQAAEAAYQRARQQVMQLQAELVARKAEVALARQHLEDCTIRAPFSGAVTRREASVGEYLPVNNPIATLVRLHPVRMRAEIPEREASRVRMGQAIDVRVQGQTSGRTGRIVRLSPAIEAQSRSLVVEGEIPNEGGTLRPGSFAEVAITVDPYAQGITIPRSAVLSFAGTDRVYITNKGVLDDRVVRIGRSFPDGGVEIVHGLEPGVEFVLNPDGRIAKGQKVVVR